MKTKVKELLRQMTGHSAVEVVARGNAALFLALRLVKELNNKPAIAIPDQGGWIMYKKYPQFFGFRIVEYPTKDGVVDVQYLKDHCNKFAAIIVTNPAGYYARQPMNNLFSVCDGKTYIIEDVSGSIGLYSDTSHIKLGSFGRWKPINVGIGGFISTVDQGMMEKLKVILTTTIVEGEVYDRIFEKLSSARQRYDFFHSKVRTIKQDLSGYDIIHRAEDGLVVVVQYNNDTEKMALIDYCHSKKIPFTDCPRYIRSKERALCLEVKRLNEDTFK